MNSMIFAKSETLSGDVNLIELSAEMQAAQGLITPTFLSALQASSDEFIVVFNNSLNASDQAEVRKVVEAHNGGKVVVPQTVTLATKTGLGVPFLATKKPDGNSVTHISHNFCDSNDWPSPTASFWEVKPPSGEVWKLLKAEVQFTHDVQISQLATPNEVIMDVMAGGQSVDQKVFKSVLDVFRYGNAHYSMDQTVDGVPGVTTVVFDYADAIVLDSSLGMSMQFELKDQTELGGTHCSISIVVDPGSST